MGPGDRERDEDYRTSSSAKREGKLVIWDYKGSLGNNKERLTVRERDF